MLKSYHHNTRNRPIIKKHSTSPLHQRMIEDMTMRKLSPKTQSGYIRAVKELTRFLGRSPDTASSEDLRRFHGRMFFDNGSVPCVVVIGLKHPYLNTGQILAANLSIPLKLIVVPMPSHLPVLLLPRLHKQTYDDMAVRVP